MLVSLHTKRALQLVLGLLIGICIGFLLQKGGATDYNVITGQLMLLDFTILKIMLSAVVVGMIGVYGLRELGLVRLHIKSGSVGSTIIGGLIFGVGFAILGYCPGTIAGAVGSGSLDALFGGMLGILTGSGIFAFIYDRLDKEMLNIGRFGPITIPQLFRVSPWRVIIPLALIIPCFMLALEIFGL